MKLPLKTKVLDVFRTPLTIPALERRWRRLTIDQPYEGLRAKLTPNCHAYREGSYREVERHGLRWEVDVSELMGWYLYFGFVDPSHDEFIKLCQPGQTVLDVGGNIGMTALRAAKKVGATGQVFAFEPDQHNCARFRRHMALNAGFNVELIEAGLGEKPGWVTIQTVDVHNRGMNQISRATPSDPAKRVELTTVDEFVRARGLTAVDVIKVDVEGFEHAAILGARNTLHTYRPSLYVEFDDGLLSQQGTSSAELLRLLDELDYRMTVAGTDTALNPEAPPKHAHFDVLCRPYQAARS
jgi:FkbM family methyltransferase